MNKIDFYISAYSYISSVDNVDLSFIPPLQKRKLSALNRAVFCSLNAVFSQDIEKIIYVSRYGEIDKLLKIIDQYNSENAVSPILFSTSVHNASVGAFSLLKKITIPYTSLSAMENSLSMGILNAVIENSSVNLICYADYINGTPCAISLKISKKASNGQHCILTMSNPVDNKIDEVKMFTEFLSNSSNVIQFTNYKIEKVSSD